MENKLQALTDKLYEDGLSKGREEGERLLREAEAQAAKTIEQAREQAKGIVDAAVRESEDLKKNALTEVNITSRQIIATLKQQIEESLMEKTVAAAVHAALEQKEFVQGLILKAMAAFNPEKNAGFALELLLPEAEREAFDKFLKDVVGQELKNGLEVKFSGDLQGGFKITDKGQGYRLGFTEEDFMALFEEYARPRIKKMLFNA